MTDYEEQPDLIKALVDIGYPIEEAKEMLSKPDVAKRIAALVGDVATDEVVDLPAHSAEQESSAEAEIRAILDRSPSSILTGLDSTGHYEYGQNVRYVSRTAESIVSATQNMFHQYPKLDEYGITLEQAKAHNERVYAHDKPGGRETLVFFRPKGNDSAVTVLYEAKGSREWTDPTGRAGQELCVGVKMSPEDARKFAGLFSVNPSIIREVAQQVTIERVGVEEEDWIKGGPRTNGQHIRPPYEVWDAETDSPPSILVISNDKSLGLPPIDYFSVGGIKDIAPAQS